MAIITITRGPLLVSTHLVDQLSERLGYRAVSRRDIADHGTDLGIDEFKLARLTTVDSTPPHLWDRHAAQRRHFLTILKASLSDFAVAGNLIYHGNLAQYLLADWPDLLRIRVTSDHETQLDNFMKEYGCSRSEAATRIREVNEHRRDWLKFLYNAKFDAPRNYDLILDFGKLNIEQMVESIELRLGSPDYEPSAQKTAQIKSARLAAQAEAALVRSPRTRGMDLEVEADAATGRLAIVGAEPMMGTEIWRRDIQSALAGLREVENLIIRPSR